MNELGKALLGLGLLLAAIGAVLLLAGRIGLPLGRLPGDIAYRGKHVSVYFPLGTSILISIVLSILFYLISHLQRSGAGRCQNAVRGCCSTGGALMRWRSPGPPGRTVLGREGSGRVVDPQGPIHRRRPAQRGPARISGGDGLPAPSGPTPLGDLTQASGKIVVAWAAEGDCDPQKLVSNQCQVEWPPRSGRMIDIPEVDRPPGSRWTKRARVFSRASNRSLIG